MAEAESVDNPLQGQYRPKFLPSSLRRELSTSLRFGDSLVDPNMHHSGSKDIEAFQLPSSISDSRRQFGSPPNLSVQCNRAEYLFSADEREVVEEPRSFHRGPLSPGSTAFRSRVFTDRVQAAQQKALRRTHRANEFLEGVVSECYMLSANANLDAFANALECHLRRGNNAASKLRAKNKYTSGRSRIWRAPGSPLMGSLEGSSFDTSLSASQRSSVSCASSDVSRDMLTLFQPKRTIPTLRFPSAKESQLAKSSKGSKGSKGNPKASLPTTQREPLQITGKKDYKTLLEEQMKLDQELQASAGRYQEMMEQFELSQRNAHRMLDMYLCTDPWAPTNNNAAFPQDDTTAA